MSVARWPRTLSGRCLASLNRPARWVGLVAAVLAIVMLTSWVWSWPRGSEWGWSAACRLARRVIWLSAAERAALRRVGISAVYVQVGTLPVGGTSLVGAPGWGPGAPEPVVWLAATIAAPPAESDPAAEAQAVWSALRPQWIWASSQGWRPVGVHLEVDGSPSVDGLARWLGSLRSALPGEVQLSTLAAPEWLSDPGFGRLAAAVDQVLLTTEWRPTPTASGPERCATGQVQAACAAGARVRVLLPTTGESEITDPAGARTGTNLSPERMPADPSWQLDLAGTRVDERGRPAEDEVEFRRAEPGDLAGERYPAGTRVTFRRPRPEALGAFLRRLREGRTPGLLGPLFEALPDESHPLALGAAELAAAAGQEPGETPPVLRAEAVDGGVRLRAHNPGGIGSAVLPGAVQMSVDIQPGFVVGVRPDAFTFEGSFREELPVPVREAEELRFSRPFLFGGEEVTVAELRSRDGLTPALRARWQMARMSGKASWHGEWTWTSPSHP
ncbi:MAG: hypothetical protein HY320_06000 [Armatimonadetes bacterium]|nr:hypothetical protein [Armatimonadota bacterium]